MADQMNRWKSVVVAVLLTSVLWALGLFVATKIGWQQVGWPEPQRLPAFGRRWVMFDSIPGKRVWMLNYGPFPVLAAIAVEDVRAGEKP